MSNCPNCGRELADGEVCICNVMNQEPVNPTAPQPEPTPMADPMPTPDSAPQYEYHPQPEYTQNEYSQQGYQTVPPQENGYYAPVPPVYYPEMKQPARTDYPMGYKIKKKYVAVILAASLGPFGIHNFYLGNKNRALAQVLLSTVGALFTFGISTAAVSVWALVEAVLLLTENIDADGEGYKIQTFEESLKDAMKD